ncbi:MAG TPA: ABC transporter substrate-binding protein, partial [Gemmataceae bacterium]|nr:ABC transporter substrate-binding protein [Gemmataceae bacterium]
MPNLSSSRGRRRLLAAALAGAAVVAAGLSGLNPAAAAGDGVLRWGGDATGGAPYIFKRGGRLVGFEVELADYLAAKFGRRADFVQKDWDSLPQDLKRGDIDCILNGYEWSAKREQALRSTVPYYVYKLQLIVRDGDTSIQSWDDLRGKKVGVLGASAAENYLQKRFGGDVEISAPVDAGTTGVMAQVAKGDLAATVQDVPAARYYVGPGREFPTLRPLGPPVEPGYYVIYVRPEDDELRDRLNEAIRDGLRDGTLRRIYEKYGLWDADQERLSEIASGPWPPEEEAPQPGRGGQVVQFAGQLALAAVTTVALSFLA